MNKKNFIYLLMLLILLVSCSKETQVIKEYLSAQDDGLYGSIKVNENYIFFELYYQETPLTVSNFVGLATGAFGENIERKENYFDGLTFHRVVENFVIQGGDPEGTGSGGPGYQFIDEFHPDLTHSDMGILSMANSGPNTNGSQFFITLAPTPHLDNRHTVFGKVLENTDILTTVVQDDVMETVEIHPKGSAAKSFINNISWDAFKQLQTDQKISLENELQEITTKITTALESNANFTSTSEGLFYEILTQGSGVAVQKGDNVEVHYELKLYQDDAIVDSSYQRDETFIVPVGADQVIQGWEIMLLKLKVGDKVHVIIPPELAYGETGAGGGIIPPNAYLDFIIEVVSIQ